MYEFYSWLVVYIDGREISYEMISWVLILIALVGYSSCYALSASSSQKVQSVTSKERGGIVVISQKSNTRVIFSFDEPIRLTDDKSKCSTELIPDISRIKYALQTTFLPTVATDADANSNLGILSRMRYIDFIIYDNVQDLVNSLRSILAKHRVLEAVGVGRVGATALSATLNFIGRDICGILSSLLFTSFAATSFRRDIKKWKFFSIIMLDVGLSCQVLASSLSTKWFLPILCLGSICEAMHNVASGPCGSVIKLHWAVKLLGSEDGIAEISAKRRALRTLIDLVGLVMANILVRSVDGIKSKALVAVMYLGLSFIHLISNQKSLQLVALDWLNGWRLDQAVQDFLQSNERGTGSEQVTVRSPEEMSRTEPLLFFSGRTDHHTIIRMGISFNELVRLSREPLSVLQLSLKKQHIDRDNDAYILSPGLSHDKPVIAISFFQNTTNKCMAKAYLHGCLLGRTLLSVTRSSGRSLGDDKSYEEIIEKAKDIAEKKLKRLWPLFERCTFDAGWKLDKTESYSEGYGISTLSLKKCSDPNDRTI